MSRRRILFGVGANLYGQLAVAAIQFASVPGFLHAWGTSRFGLWLTLVAATSALSLADCGMTVTSATAMTVAVARGRLGEAGRLFARGACFVGSGTTLLAVLLVLLTGSLLDTLGWAPSAPSDDVRWCLVFLGGTALLGLHLSVLDAGFRANGDYGLGLAAVSTLRLLEAAAALSAALAGGGLLAAAVAQLATRGFGVVAMALLLKHRAPWVTLAGADLRWSRLRSALPPALAALAIPAGFAASLQGMTLVAGLVTAPGGVATFVAVRTLTRTLVQALGLFNHALMPEMSIAAGRGDTAAMRALLRWNFWLGGLTLLPGWLVLVAFGPGLLSWWTGGALGSGRAVFATLATAALLHGAWLSSANLLLALNRQADYAYLFLAVAVATCALGAGLGHIDGLLGLCVAALFGEAAMAAALLPRQLRAAGGRGPALLAREVEA